MTETTFSKTIGLEQWTSIRNNPRQRDTERHASKIEQYLQVVLPVHATVAAAQLPDGSFVKLDGHSRSLLWDENRIPTPNVITMQVYPVADLAGAALLYGTYDSPTSVETNEDRVCGAFRLVGFYPASAILRKGTLTRAFGVVEYARSGGAKVSSRGRVDVIAGTKEWRRELPGLDRIIQGHSTKKLPAGVLAGILLSIRKRGLHAVEDFWNSYLDPDEAGGIRDPHNVLLNTLRRQQDRKATNGIIVARDIASKAVAACEHGLKGNQIKYLQGTDIAKYLGAVDSKLPAASQNRFNKSRDKNREEPRPTI